MKILRTKNGNALIASNIVFISKEVNYCTNDKITHFINAVDLRGQTYCLVDEIIDSDVDKKFQNIMDYLTKEGD